MKPNVLFALLLVMGIHVPLAHATKLYKWVDEQGNVTYQDRPPPANASEVEEKHIDPNEGVTKFVVPKPAESSSDGALSDSGPQAPSSGSGGLSTAEKGAIITSDRPLRSERRRGVTPTPPPRPAPAVPPRVGRRPGGGTTRPMPHR